ncbi:transcriptional regulator, Sir2 family [Reticulomyxa filosa]|uniref:Transcriptional regulator, Sir2 family n=1 Tax=Reticulomyxa filosa TaxID=46433 RepID=X6NY11_RETFI|nr:transcriptional regulator, Sir2 family [Reticulomyxa filosa]|eukprot:ETO30172.1 transcriptional regulator, Sir2 family [Reticulomyxa filosa]
MASNVQLPQKRKTPEDKNEPEPENGGPTSSKRRKISATQPVSAEDEPEDTTGYYTLHLNENMILYSDDPVYVLFFSNLAITDLYLRQNNKKQQNIFEFAFINKKMAQATPRNVDWQFEADNEQDAKNKEKESENEPNLKSSNSAETIKNSNFHCCWRRHRLRQVSTFIWYQIEIKYILLYIFHVYILYVNKVDTSIALKNNGLPDYRSKHGFWRDYLPLKHCNLSLYEMSQSNWFINDPLTAWGFYSHRKFLYEKTSPHHGFTILKNWIDQRDYFIMTSKFVCFDNSNHFTVNSIDGQFIKAGFPQDKIWETHGSLFYLQCCQFSNCGNDSVVKFNQNIDIDETTFKVKEEKQVCIYLFVVISFICYQSGMCSCLQWLSPFINDKKQLIVIEIGCGNSMHSLHWEVEFLSTLSNVTIIRINPSISNNKETQRQTDNHIFLMSGAKHALEAIQNKIEKN